ncbi:MAG: hypothetical protein WB611_07505, partial [Stellaceae bacterium]
PAYSACEKLPCRCIARPLVPPDPRILPVARALASAYFSVSLGQYNMVEDKIEPTAVQYRTDAEVVRQTAWRMASEDIRNELLELAERYQRAAADVESKHSVHL